MAVSADARGNRAVLLREPYRLFFPGAALYALAVMAGWALWLLYLGGLGPGVPIPAIPPGWLHGHTQVWGVLQLFIFGFILTALPRQCRHPNEVPPRRWVGLIALFLLAQAGIWIGGLGGWVALAIGAGCLGALLMLGTAAGLARWLPDAGNPHQPRYALAALAISGGAALLDALAWGLSAPGLHDWAIRAGLYAEMGLALALSHRLVPMFARNAIPGYQGSQGPRFLPVLAAGIGVRLVLAASPGSGAALAGGAVDVLLAGWVLRELLRWSPATAVHRWLVGAKLVPMAWFVVGLALSGAVALGASWPDAGRAWVHAVGLGGMASLALVFSMRVSLGHAGRALDPDRALRVAFWLLQGSVLLRLLLPLWTPEGQGGMMTATHWAAWLWLAAFAIWLVRLLPRMAEHS
ncbi:NnrS family protein [Thiohalorhabdus sp. Cl-TMA]|uniref:NnrS family protein n=1 Tax=Thiohalorhabdus methylotrophus TaxID=3242694 RepID=A0ABV4TVZ8_9GAMM